MAEHVFESLKGWLESGWADWVGCSLVCCWTRPEQTLWPGLGWTVWWGWCLISSWRHLQTTPGCRLADSWLVAWSGLVGQTSSNPWTPHWNGASWPRWETRQTMPPGRRCHTTPDCSTGAGRLRHSCWCLQLGSIVQRRLEQLVKYWGRSPSPRRSSQAWQEEWSQVWATSCSGKTGPLQTDWETQRTPLACPHSHLDCGGQIETWNYRYTY